MSASTRPVKLDDWGISWEEYKELTYFCLQYEQKRREASALLTIRLSTPLPAIYHKGGKEYGTFLPRGGGRISDPVAATAAKRDRLLRDVRMIEQAAQAACEDEGEGMYTALLRAVTTRCGVQAVYANPDLRPPKGEKQFYGLRRKFFWILREMRCGDLEPIAKNCCF